MILCLDRLRHGARVTCLVVIITDQGFHPGNNSAGSFSLIETTTPHYLYNYVLSCVTVVDKGRRS